MNVYSPVDYLGLVFHPPILVCFLKLTFILVFFLGGGVTSKFHAVMN